MLLTTVKSIAIYVVSVADLMGFPPPLSFLSHASADERGGDAGAVHAGSRVLLPVCVRVGVCDWCDRLSREEQRAQRQDL